jgi:hypothetical protein
MKPKRLKRRTVYQSPWVTLHLDRVRMPDGHVSEDFHFLDFAIEAVGVLVEDAPSGGDSVALSYSRYFQEVSYAHSLKRP